MGKIYIDGQEYTKTRIGAFPHAKDQIFNNTNTSNITSENTQGALDELDSTIGNLDSINSSSDIIVGIVSEFNSKISALDSKAKGAGQSGAIFKTFADMETWLKNVSNKNKVTVGYHLYIEAIGVPDYWITEVLDTADATTSYYYAISQLESKKEDLSAFTNKFGNSDISSLGDGSISGAINTLNNENIQLTTKVSDGKALIANAITAKGISTSTTEDFDVLAANITNLVPNPILQEKTVTLDANTSIVEVTPDNEYNGLSKVTANILTQTKSTNISTGSVTVTPDEGKVMSSVSITGPTNMSGTTQTADVSTSSDGNTKYFTVPTAGYYTTTSKIGNTPGNIGVPIITVDGIESTSDLNMIELSYNEQITTNDGKTLPALSTLLADYLPEGFTPTNDSKIYLTI